MEVPHSPSLNGGAAPNYTPGSSRTKRQESDARPGRRIARAVIVAGYCGGVQPSVIGQYLDAKKRPVLLCILPPSSRLGGIAAVRAQGDRTLNSRKRRDGPGKRPGPTGTITTTEEEDLP